MSILKTHHGCMNNCPHCGKPLHLSEEEYKKIYGKWTTKEIIEATYRILNEEKNKKLSNSR